MSDWDAPDTVKESLLALPIIDPLGDGYVNISWPQDKITAHLEGMWRSGSRFETVMRIRHDELGTIHALTRINLLSTSARTELVRSLEKRYPGLGWNSRVDGIIEAADKVYRSELTITTVGEKQPQPIQYLVRPLLEVGNITGIAADPGTGKSMMALALALQVGGHGVLVPGTGTPTTIGRTLYLDWEDDEGTHGSRLHALLAGVGRKAPPLPVKHVRMHGALTDSADKIIRMCRTEKPAMVVIDSVGSAVVGRINEPEFVLPLMDACRSMRSTVLLLGHLTKHESDGKLIGTVFWFTIPRLAWHLAKAQDEGESESRLVLNHKKTNNNMIFKPMGFRVEFENDGDMMRSVRYYSTDISADPALAKFSTTADKITQFLLENGRQQVSAVVEGTKLPLETVRSALKRGTGRRFVMFGSGRMAQWAVLSQSEMLSGASGASHQVHAPDDRVQQGPFKGPPTDAPVRLSGSEDRNRNEPDEDEDLVYNDAGELVDRRTGRAARNGT